MKGTQVQGVAEATAAPGENPVDTRKQKQNCWAIVLAGGEGTRLADFSCRIAGEKTPKQFCRIMDDQSLIEQTRRRVELAIPRERIFYTLSRSHERYYVPNLLALMISTVPELYDLFAEFSGTLGTEFETEAVEKIYRAIAPVDFCKSVLSAHAGYDVSVLPVSGLYWNDLGNSSRVLATIARLGLRPKWMAQFP